MPIPYPPAAVVNSFISQNEITHDSLTHLKIQKLLYYAQGWHMANYRARLFDEDIEAWRHGPVVRSVYQILAGSGDSEITQRLTGVYGGNYITPIIDCADTSTQDFLKQFWEKFHGLHAYALTNATHLPGTPWRTVYDSCNGYLGFGEIIPDELIYDYFSRQMTELA